MVDQERSTLFIDLMVELGRIGCSFSGTVISMVKENISRVNRDIPHVNSMGEVAQYASNQSRQQESTVNTNETNIL